VHVRLRPADYDRIYLLARQAHISIPEFFRRQLRGQRQAQVSEPAE
jgi:hypothetical protein